MMAPSDVTAMTTDSRLDEVSSTPRKPAMKTSHQVLLADSRDLRFLPDQSVELIITSPPYPMIEMWDAIFRWLDPTIGHALDKTDGLAAFELMHFQLDRVWRECHRVLRPGCFACINIGDATRTIAGEFQLFPNHARILQALMRMGFRVLPDILWHKPTNSPNKFLGSGMLPAGAYVTFEHEYILVARKGGKREFKSQAEKLNRRRSAYFRDERDQWFTDIWKDFRGASQTIAGESTRTRSGAFPLELAYRLVQMYSVCGDRVLDPFLGTGTTSLAAMSSRRNSIGVEIEGGIAGTIQERLFRAVEIGRRRVEQRLIAQRNLAAKLAAQGKPMKYCNRPQGLPVRSKQEVDMVLTVPVRVCVEGPGRFVVEHADIAPDQADAKVGHAVSAPSPEEEAIDGQAARHAS